MVEHDFHFQLAVFACGDARVCVQSGAMPMGVSVWTMGTNIFNEITVLGDNVQDVHLLWVLK